MFAAGLSLNAVLARSEAAEQREVDEGVNRYLVLPVFVLLGVVLPWAGWADLGWALVPFGAALLLVRRLPWAIATLLGAGRPLAGAALIGWFGPIGVSAVFYLAHAHHVGVLSERSWAAGTFAVALSTVVHGASTLPARRAYQRAVAR